MSVLNPGMEKLIRMVSMLHHTFSRIGIPLHLNPLQIAVIGSQSAGKSSVLESFVGRDFLPLGSGIVTRRPLVLHLVYSNMEYGEFLHMTGNRIVDFEEIRKEIEKETARAVGRNKNVSAIPIQLTIHSPHVLNLTLVDLPGMTKVPIGEQPRDIEKLIKDMVLDYIKKENCLILAVSPANCDLATSDALQLAKQVDPLGQRTVGVITKLDLMDEGTDARQILENRVLPLRWGYVGIVSRSQKDIDGKVDISVGLARERAFFLAHPAYRHMASRMGTPYLQHILNQQFTAHIREILQNFREMLQTQLLITEKELAHFKTIMPEDLSQRTKVMLVLVQELGRNFEHAIEGSTIHSSIDISLTSLNCGARIYRIFHERFPLDLAQLEVMEMELRREIAFAIRNIHGVRVGLFTPDKAFEAIVRTQIIKLQEPGLRCVEAVMLELVKTVGQICERMSGFPKLQMEVLNLIAIHARERERFTKDQIKTAINVELAYINANHEDFLGFENRKLGSPNTKPSLTLFNPVLRKGILTVHKNGFVKGAKEQLIVLTTHQLLVYNETKESDKKMIIEISGLSYLDGEMGLPVKRPVVILLYRDGRPIQKGLKQLEMSCPSLEEMDSWKFALTKAGIVVAPKVGKVTKTISLSEADFPDPLLENQVESVRNLVDSYLRIVTKNLRDQIPKIIVYHLINDMRKFIHSELFPTLHDITDHGALMEESSSAKTRRNSTFTSHYACREGLKIISEILSETICATSKNQVLSIQSSEESFANFSTPDKTSKVMESKIISSSLKQIRIGNSIDQQDGDLLEKHESNILLLAFGDSNSGTTKLPAPLSPSLVRDRSPTGSA